jgi:hypothetical protein
MAQRNTAWDDEREAAGQPDPSALPDDQTATSAEGVSDPEALKHTHTDGQTPKRPAARRGGTKKAAKRSDSAAIIKLPLREQPVEPVEEVEEEDGDAAIEALAAQGFTTDEVLRLIRFSGRLANSHEARESEATLRRLRFTRWLIEHGVLDEFSA